MTEHQSSEEGAEGLKLTEVERDDVWRSVATTCCGPLHADRGWTPGEPCAVCEDRADAHLPHLARVIEGIVALRLAARAESAEAENTRLRAEVEALADAAEAEAGGE